MKYLIELSEYNVNGYHYTQTVESGETKEKIDLEEFSNEYEVEDEDKWYIIKALYYKGKKDPLFDDPDEIEEIAVSSNVE